MAACAGEDGAGSRPESDESRPHGRAIAAEVVRAEDLPAVPIGSSVDSFSFVDSRYLPRTLDELGDPAALVVAFTAVPCPASRHYLPILRDLERSYRDRGVSFLSVNVGPRDTIAGASAQATALELDFPVVKDFTGEVVAALGATRTPEVAVLDGEGVLRYRGCVDDGFRSGASRRAEVRPFLRAALDAVLEDREVAVSETPVEGSPIAFRRPAPDPELTWADDVAPLVRDNCRVCHQPGGVAPFPLVTHGDVVRRAAMIAEVVEQQRMPPWFASPDATHVAEPRVLEPSERDTILAWIRAGAPAGDAPRSPPAEEESERAWRIRPDLVLEADRETVVPAEGASEYVDVSISHVFERDTFVSAIEVRPSNRRVLHHGNVAMFYEGRGGRRRSTNLHMYVPGGDPLDLEPGVAMLIHAGSTLELQLHYTPTGVEERDRVSVGLRFPKERVRKRFYSTTIRDHRFRIPPHHPAFPVSGTRNVGHDITLVSTFGHMHLRGKDMRLWVDLPGGRRETLLVIGNYNFDWQRKYYFEPGEVKVPAGSRFTAVGRFDNSTFNPYNPDPTRRVRFGRSTFREMMYCWVYFTRDHEILNVGVDPDTGERLRRGGSR